MKLTVAKVKITQQCKQCGNDFTRLVPKNFASRIKYCSKACCFKRGRPLPKSTIDAKPLSSPFAGWQPTGAKHYARP